VPNRDARSVADGISFLLKTNLCKGLNAKKAKYRLLPK